MTRKENTILILASIGTFVEALDIAIINLTIPAIQQQFQVDKETVQWLQTLYVLFFGGFLIIGGKLTDHIGKKKIFMWGTVLFFLSSLGAGLSSNFILLAVFRAIQGFGAALLMPASLAIVTHTFRQPKERSRALGIFSSFAAIGSGSGLSVGGLISTYISWNWVFLINVPILLFTFFAALYHFPKDPVAEKKNNVDVVASMLLVSGLLLLTFGVHDLPYIEERPFSIIGLLLLSFLLLATFVSRLLTQKHPLIDPALFSNQSLVVSNLSFFLLGAFFIGFLFLISLMLQQDMEYSAAGAGLLLVPFSMLSALIAKFAIPKISDRLSTVTIGILGMFFMFSGAIALLAALYLGHPLPLVLFGAACISGIGMTLCFTSLSVLGVRNVPATHYGVASSLTSTTYFLGAGIGLSVLSFAGQFVPGSTSVGPLALCILAGYAAVAGGLLVYLGIADKRKHAIVATV
ncbi:EmrB/QacA subfamily drug resistance transporter [Sphingobacterium allocomposti]|uniref:EmrB/QacA subfamily drug resistance transporter n=1 Tax=Sphingobacterium allocomposti TaxID=415956 RepID=A0A5S5D4Y8_9SPHI|nr:MFS transporter [Sphingobacterium composti Yoo et al. 2007 non Ten et al. 2007]TYP91040.1 EmrB/QacA subfamily drug resistance transporter [Sphingobacterium composti Yoo et al. 2007 non Ten et al. 2007]